MQSRSLEGWLTFRGLLLILAYAMAFFGSYSLLSAVFDRQAPIYYIDASTEQKVVPQGGDIDIHFDLYRRQICNIVKVNRILTDSEGTEHAIANYTLSSTTRPGRESYDRTITVPTAAAIGPANYRIKIAYACNIVHRLGWPVTVTSPRVWFRITKAVTLVLPVPSLDKSNQHD